MPNMLPREKTYPPDEQATRVKDLQGNVTYWAPERPRASDRRRLAEKAALLLVFGLLVALCRIVQVIGG